MKRVNKSRSVIQQLIHRSLTGVVNDTAMRYIISSIQKLIEFREINIININSNNPTIKQNDIPVDVRVRHHKIIKIRKMVNWLLKPSR